MDRHSNAEDLLIDAVKDLQLAARETAKAVAELDKQVSLINLKISAAASAAALLATLLATIVERFTQ